MPAAEPSRRPVRVPGQEEAAQRATLRAIALSIGVVSLVVMAIDMVLAPAGESEAGVAAFMAVVAWAAWFLLRRGRWPVMPVAAVIVFGVLITAILSVLSFGSVRTAVNFLFVGAVAGAGVFLGRRALVVTVLGCIAMLGMLTWAEMGGWLGKAPDFSVGLRVWITQAASLAVIGTMVYHSRQATGDALARAHEELEHRRAVAAERDRSLDRFARIFRTSPSPMLAQSAHTGMILDTNPAFERVYGYRHDQVVGNDDRFLWADPAERAHYRQRLLDERSVENFRCRGRRANGTVFETVISSVMGEDSDDKLVITTVSPVSEEAMALERLRRSEERFAKAFNFSPLNMTITRLSDGAFIEVNRSEDRVQGYAPEELRGHTSVSIGAWLTPDDRARFVEQLQRDGRIDGYETQMRHRDGSLVDCRLYAELIEVEGEPCILSATMDVREEKRRQQQLLQVARGVASATGEAFFHALVKHLAEAVGADRVVVGETEGAHVVNTLSVWDGGGLVANHRFDKRPTPCFITLQSDGLFVCESGLSARFPRAADGFEAYAGQALRDASGAPVGVVFALWKSATRVNDDRRALLSIFASRAQAELLRLQRDREIRRLNETLEQRVRERTAELQALNAELDAFAYSVSHDLKSPLRTIDGFTRLLQEQLGDRLTPDDQALLDRVLSSTQRMSSIIADLLSLARVSQGTLACEWVDISALASEVLAVAQEREGATGLQAQVSPGLRAWCDPRLARLVLENLLSNAVKYSRKRPDPRVEVVGEQTGAVHWLAVRDNGVGFDMQFADQLFKPFKRLHLASEFEGTGIGLATVRRIVERHGGAIEARARLGEGAEFRLHFGPNPGA